MDIVNYKLESFSPYRQLNKFSKWERK